MSFETPIGRFTFAQSLGSPIVKEGKDGKSYQQRELVLLLQQDDDISALEAAVEEVLKEKFPNGKRPPMNRLKLPIKLTEDGVSAKTGEPYAGYEDAYYAVKLISYREPTLRGPDGKTQIDGKDIYNGCYGRVRGFAKWFDFTDDKGVSVSGIRFILTAVQKTGEGEPLAVGEMEQMDFEPVKGTEEDAKRKLFG